MHYEVTIYFIGQTNSTTFKVDKDEIHEFVKFITEHVSKLYSFNVIRRHPNEKV